MLTIVCQWDGLLCCQWEDLRDTYGMGVTSLTSVGGLLCSSLAVSGRVLLQQQPFSADSDPQCKFLGNNNFEKLNSAKT